MATGANYFLGQQVGLPIAYCEQSVDKEKMPADGSNSRLEERFVRWQEELRESLGKHVTLIIAFASGGLGFVGSILRDDKAALTGLSSSMLLATGVLFLVSLSLAMLISFYRLRDVRSTLGILRKRREKAAQSAISELKSQNEVTSNRIWLLVYFQIGVFSLAALAFSASVFVAYKHRLFPPAAVVPVAAPVAPAIKP